MRLVRPRFSASAYYLQRVATELVLTRKALVYRDLTDLQHAYAFTYARDSNDDGPLFNIGIFGATLQTLRNEAQAPSRTPAEMVHLTEATEQLLDDSARPAAVMARSLEFQPMALSSAHCQQR